MLLWSAESLRWPNVPLGRRMLLWSAERWGTKRRMLLWSANEAKKRECSFGAQMRQKKGNAPAECERDTEIKSKMHADIPNLHAFLI